MDNGQVAGHDGRTMQLRLQVDTMRDLNIRHGLRRTCNLKVRIFEIIPSPQKSAPVERNVAGVPKIVTVKRSVPKNFRCFATFGFLRWRLMRDEKSTNASCRKPC
jgi:hypothetical protein